MPAKPARALFLPIVAGFIPLVVYGVLMLGGFQSGWMLAIAGLALIGAVLLAVHHAELIAHRLGEPRGTLVLALAITMIETGLILAIMMAPNARASELARDSIYATLMITCTGVLGLCLFYGGLRHREQHFRVEGASSALASLVTLSVITLVMPNFATTTVGPTYAPIQLIVIAISSLVLWGTFVAVQTGRHRSYFALSEAAGGSSTAQNGAEPSLITRVIPLISSLVAVVLLAKFLSPPLQGWMTSVGAPHGVLGVVIAGVVLLPESIAAIRASRANQFQLSTNLALGSALASTGLTIPSVAVASLILHKPLVLGLEPKNMVMLALAFAVNSITLGLGRSNVLLGVVHLVIFVTFLLLAFVP